MGFVGMVAVVGDQDWGGGMVLVGGFGRVMVGVVMDLARVGLDLGVLVWVGAIAKKGVWGCVNLETCVGVVVVGLFGVMVVFGNSYGWWCGWGYHLWGCLFCRLGMKWK